MFTTRPSTTNPNTNRDCLSTFTNGQGQSLSTTRPPMTNPNTNRDCLTLFTNRESQSLFMTRPPTTNTDANRDWGDRPPWQKLVLITNRD